MRLLLLWELLIVGVLGESLFSRLPPHHAKLDGSLMLSIHPGIMLLWRGAGSGLELGRAHLVAALAIRVTQTTPPTVS